MNILTIGDNAPDFSGDSTHGNILMPKILVKYIVLYFYPKDMTPGCTIQAQEFTKLYEEFKAVDSEIVGVSKDGLSSHQKFKEKENIPYPLLLDIEEKICNLYGVISEKNMFGKKYLGVNRTTFLIDGQRKIIKIWKQVKPTHHAKIVLDTIKFE